jgi:hypothetical protein
VLIPFSIRHLWIAAMIKPLHGIEKLRRSEIFVAIESHHHAQSSGGAGYYCCSCLQLVTCSLLAPQDLPRRVLWTGPKDLPRSL